MLLAGVVTSMADFDHCNPKMLSSTPAAGKDFPSARKV